MNFCHGDPKVLQFLSKQFFRNGKRFLNPRPFQRTWIKIKNVSPFIAHSLWFKTIEKCPFPRKPLNKPLESETETAAPFICFVSWKFQPKSRAKETPKSEMITRTEMQKMAARVAEKGRKPPTKKFQQVVENLKRKGDADDTSGEEGEENEEEEEESDEERELELPQVIGVSLNLSKKKLKKFPEKLLEKMRQVEYLYLEGNKLTELPQNFFQSLTFLKWLDLRNNNLSFLPTKGLKQHPCLEVILLHGNRIRNLPTELSTIPTLKGLQTSGNPITNVPYEIIAGGFQSIIKHLEKIHSQEEILLPVSSSVVVKPSTSQDYSAEIQSMEPNEPSYSELRMWDMDKLSQWRHFMKRKSGNVQSSVSQHIINNINEKSTSEQPKISVMVRSQPKLPAKPFRCGVYNRNRHRSAAAALRYLKMRKTALGYKRKPITYEMIQEKARQEAQRAQVRETLEKQAKKIQRMRDKETLKHWRNHATLTRQQMKLLDNYQQYPSKDFAEKTPFDVDPEFLNMLNRIDLYRSLKDYDNRSQRKKKTKVKITALDLERQMNEIMKKLEELDVKEGENYSPRTKHSHMCNKMSKIMDIQKTLRNLQALNSSMTSTVKRNPKK